MLEDYLLVENNMLDETVGTLVILLIFAPMGSNVKKLHDLMGGGQRDSDIRNYHSDRKNSYIYGIGKNSSRCTRYSPIEFSFA